MPHETFGKRVLYARKTMRGLSQRALAAAITKRLKLEKPLSHAAVGKWDNDHRKEAAIESDTLFALADECNVNARWLALGTGSPQKWENVTPEEKKLLEHFRSMDDDWRAKLLDWAADLPKADRQPSRADPYPHLPTPRRQR